MNNKVRYIGDRVLSIEILPKEEIDEENKYRKKYGQDCTDWEKTKQIRLREMCDEYFTVGYSKEEAIKLFENIIAWIKEDAIDNL